MEVHMTSKIIIAAGILAVLFTAAPQQAQAESIRAQCEDYAYRAAYREDSRDQNIGQGAVGGAVAGGILGAILGKGKGKNIGKGAIIGGVAGTVLGATNQRDGYIDRRAYNRAYNDCRNEGTRVQYRSNRNRDDVQYCLERYRSYNPRTGQYLTNSGRYRDCP
jgi:uncharacterized protein YcfJ